MMNTKLFVWNCQGGGNVKFPKTLKEYTRAYHPDIVSLFETRVSGETADRVIRKLGFPFSHRIEACGFSGGIWLLWKENISLTKRFILFSKSVELSMALK